MVPRFKVDLLACGPVNLLHVRVWGDPRAPAKAGRSMLFCAAMRVGGPHLWHTAALMEGDQ